MRILGGAVASSGSGCSIYVAAFLLPIGGITYTFVGSLQATVSGEYPNSVFILAVKLIFVIVIYFTNHDISGIGGRYKSSQRQLQSNQWMEIQVERFSLSRRL